MSKDSFLNNNLKSFKNLNLTLPWSGTCYLKKDRVSDYLSKWGSTGKYFKFKLLIEEILKYTIYVSFDEFLTLLQTHVNYFASSFGGKKHYILTDCTKFGSEMWLLHLLYNKNLLNSLDFDMIETLNFQSIKQNDEISILFIDDCLYSGSHIVNTLQEFYIKLIDYFAKDKELIKTLKIVIHVVSAFHTETSRNYLQDFINFFDDVHGLKSEYFFHSRKLYDDQFVPNSVAQIFKDMSFEEFVKSMGKRRDAIITLNNILDTTKLDINLGMPIYFDHKIANKISSFPSIYLEGIYYDDNNNIKYYGPLVNNIPNRYMNDFLDSLYYKVLKTHPCGPNFQLDHSKHGKALTIINPEKKKNKLEKK